MKRELENKLLERLNFYNDGSYNSKRIMWIISKTIDEALENVKQEVLCNAKVEHIKEF